MNIEAKKDGTNAVTVFMDGNAGNVVAGGNGQGGSLILKDKSGTHRIHLLGDLISDPEEFALTANIVLRGDNGSIALHGTASVQLYAAPGQAGIVLNGPSGSVVLRKNNQDSIVLNPQLGNIAVGGPAGAAGNIFLYPENSSAASIELNGQLGDIILKNADCAEEFDISESEEVVPGSVMVFDQEGRLQQSREAYDKKVAGVISGAGNFQPGIVLDRKHSRLHRMPLALVGKVYCKADANFAPIEIGDLLTTSPTPGHAMKATDSAKAFGAVIGKALRPQKEGQGLIPMLIALQ
jgi:hypothetical protein